MNINNKEIDNSVKGERMIADALASAKSKSTIENNPDTFQLSVTDTVLLNISNTIIKQLEASNEFLYSTIDAFLGKDLRFKLKLEDEENIATVTIDVDPSSKLFMGADTTKMFKSTYDSTVLGESHLPAVVKVNAALIQVCKEVLVPNITNKD